MPARLSAEEQESLHAERIKEAVAESLTRPHTHENEEETAELAHLYLALDNLDANPR